jgi:DHA3 family macrolide efflux protein-like MFS transporter
MATQFSEADNRPWKRPFFTIWFGQAFSLLGSQIVQFALIWYLTQETGSATVLATATLVGMLPQIVLGPFIGSFVDRGNRRRIMILADGGIALVTVFLAVLFALGWVQVWHIYALLLLRSLGQAFHGPAFSASTSLMVPVEFLARLQGVNQTLQGGLSIISAPLGALLLGLLDMQYILAIDVTTAAIAILPLLFVAIPQPERKKRKSDGQESTYWEDFREGFSYVWGWPGLMIIMVMATLINFLLVPASSLSPLLITEHFGGGATQLGWFEAIFSSGVIAGGILLGVWGGFKKRVVTVLFGLVGLGAGMALIGWVPADRFDWALGSMLLAGVMAPIVNGSLGAIFQAAIDPAIQGRVFTLINSLATGISPLGLLMAGPIADRLGVQSWYLAGGVVCALLGVWGFSNRHVMGVEEGRGNHILEGEAELEIA